MAKKRVAEGFGPIYDWEGNILPKSRGLGPKRWEDIKWQRMPKDPKPKPEKKKWYPTVPKSKWEKPIRPGTKRYFA